MRYGYIPTTSDLIALSLYRSQSIAFGITLHSYLSYLDMPQNVNDLSQGNTADEKRSKLTEITGWKKDELDYLIGYFNSNDQDSILWSTDQTNFNTVIGIQTLFDCFELSASMNLSVSSLSSIVALSDLLISSQSDWDEYAVSYTHLTLPTTSRV